MSQLLLNTISTSGSFINNYLVEENMEFSVMTGNVYTNYSMYQALKDLRIYDIAYLQYRFGINKESRTGDDHYTFKNVDTYQSDLDHYIWDAGGVDTFNASQEKQGVYVNLTPGSWSFVGNHREQNFSVKHATNYDAKQYFNLDSSASVAISNLNRNTLSVTMNEYTEGQVFIGNGTQIEHLIGSSYQDTLIGNEADNSIYGGEGDDIIMGGSGNDHLDGGKGSDQLKGEQGDDIYMIDNSGDTIVEVQDQGIDQVYSSVDYALAENVEQLTLIGTVAKQATGNSADNTLVANNVGNILIGGAGNDRLIGGNGSDQLMGGEGEDTFVFGTTLNGEVDTIQDFDTQQDTIELSRAIFNHIETPEQISQHIKYEQATGNLYYLRNNSEIAEGIHFATLVNKATLTENHFVLG